MRDEAYLTKIIPYLESEYFSLPYTKTAFNTIKTIFSKKGLKPYLNTIRAEINTTPDISSEEYQVIHEMFDDIESMDIDIDYLIPKTEEHIKDCRLKSAIQESISIYNGESKQKTASAIPELIRDALNINFDSSVGMSFLNDAEERYEYYINPESKILMGFEILDERTNGGIPRKTLNSFLAPTNVGKTLALCSTAVYYCMAGLTVMYISGEMRAEEILKRIDSNIMGFNMRDTGKLNKTSYMKRIVELREQKSHGDIIVKDFPPNTFNVAHIRNLMKEYEMLNNKKIDILMVDYLGLMASSILKRSLVNTYEYQKSVAEELRGLASEMDVVCWTAVQTNRSGVEKGESTDVDAVADSYGVPQTMDYMLSLWRTPESDMSNIIFAKEVKSRYGNKSDCPLIKIGVDLYRQRLFDIRVKDDENEKRKLREMAEERQEKREARLKKRNIQLS